MLLREKYHKKTKTDLGFMLLFVFDFLVIVIFLKDNNLHKNKPLEKRKRCRNTKVFYF